VYSPGTFASKQFSGPLVFIDTKGELFDVKLAESMSKLEKMCSGLMNYTPLDTDEWKDPKYSDSTMKPDIAVLTINARLIVQPNEDSSAWGWASSWFISPSYSLDPLDGCKQLKDTVEKLLRRERSCYLLFTHMDELSSVETDLLYNKLQKENITEVDLIYASKTCKDQKQCDHWSVDTLDGYRRFLANVDATIH